MQSGSQYPPVYPNWGESIGRGIERGFDSLMGGLAAGRQNRMMMEQQDYNRQMKQQTMQQQAQQQQREYGLKRFELAGETGYDPGPGVWGEYQDFISPEFLEAGKAMGIAKRDKLQAEVEAAKAQRQAWERMSSGGIGTGPQVVREPVTGKYFLAQPGKLGMRYTQMQGQELGVEQARQIGNAAAGLSAIEDIRKILKGPAGSRAIFKAGGAGSTLLSLGDTTAQNLATYIGEASDVLARMRTGAQINEEELRYYKGLLANRYRTRESNLRALDVVERFLKRTGQEVLSGSRGPGKDITSYIIQFESDGGEAKQGIPRQDTILKKTQKEVFDELSGQGYNEDAIFNKMIEMGY